MYPPYSAFTRSLALCAAAACSRRQEGAQQGAAGRRAERAVATTIAISSKLVLSFI